MAPLHLVCSCTRHVRECMGRSEVGRNWLPLVAFWLHTCATAHPTPTIISIAKMSSQANLLNPSLVCPGTTAVGPSASPSLLYPFSIIHKQSKNCNPQTDLTCFPLPPGWLLGWNSRVSRPAPAISLTMTRSVYKQTPAFDLYGFHRKLHVSKKCCYFVYTECTVIWRTLSSFTGICRNCWFYVLYSLTK